MANTTLTNSFRSTGGSVIECSYRQLLERSIKKVPGKQTAWKNRADTIHRFAVRKPATGD